MFVSWLLSRAPLLYVALTLQVYIYCLGGTLDSRLCTGDTGAILWVSERKERERDRLTDRETDRQKER